MSSIQARNINHPQHRENLKEEKYALIRAAMLNALPGPDADAAWQRGMPFSDLEAAVRAYLEGQRVPMALFPRPGSVRWYTKAVQLDLEARGIIERLPGVSPLRLRKASE